MKGQPSTREHPMTAHLSHHSVSPLRRRMIEDMTVRNGSVQDLSQI
jgi:hypothetical protein